MKSASALLRTFTRQVGITQGAVLFVGFLYVTGYYINSIFLRNYGIPDVELLRLEYIKIGFVFCLIVGGIVILPLGAFFLTRQVRRSSGLPHFHVGWIGNSLNAIVMIGTPLFLSVFATRFEWYLPLRISLLGCRTFNMAVGIALALSSVLVVVLPLAERLIRKYAKPDNVKSWFRYLIEPVRFGGLGASLYLIVGSIVQVPWIPTVFARAGSFFAVLCVFSIGFIAAIYWVQHIKEVKGGGVVLLLIGFGVCFCYYLAIASYVFGVYPAIPRNRGGRLPVTEAYLDVKDHESLFVGEKHIKTVVVRGPVYILEETNDTVYFIADGMDNWFDQFLTVHVLRKDSISYIRVERIDDGFPRVKRVAPSP